MDGWGKINNLWESWTLRHSLFMFMGSLSIRNCCCYKLQFPFTQDSGIISGLKGKTLKQRLQTAKLPLNMWIKQLQSHETTINEI